jgi:glucose-1-phosphate thymidylyltransferase
MAVTAVLLAAGYATRLYPLTKDRPKALLPLGAGVILDEVIRSLPGVPGLRQQLLVTNRRFAKPFSDWAASRGSAVQVIDDGTETAETRLGAIRDLELAWKRSGSDDLLVLGTDNVFDWPLARFVEQAQAKRPHPSVALWKAEAPSEVTQFGVVIRDPSGRLTQFAEKSPTPPSTEVALCVYYFPSEMCGRIREFLDSGENADAPGYFIKWLAQQGPAFGLMMGGVWHDIGTLKEYEAVVAGWPQPTPGGRA